MAGVTALGELIVGNGELLRVLLLIAGFDGIRRPVHAASVGCTSGMTSETAAAPF